MKFRKKLFLAGSSLLFALTFTPMVYAFNLEAAQAYNKALDLYIKGYTTDAITYFESAVRLDPEFADAYYNLGSIYRYTSQLDKAEESFQKVLSLKPDDSSVNYDLSLVYIQKNDLKRALNFLKLVTKDSEKYADAQSKMTMLEDEMKVMGLTSSPTTESLAENKTEKLTENKTEKSVDHLSAKKQEDSSMSNNKTDSVKKTSTEEKKINKTETNSKTSKRKLSKKERSNLSKNLATSSFIENTPDNRTEVREITLNEESDVNNTPNDVKSKQNNSENKSWENYNTQDQNQYSRKTSASNDNIDEDKVAVSYMAIEDTNVSGKLKLSPKSVLVNENNTVNTVNTKKTPASRMAVKTIASGFNGPTGIVRDNQGNIFVANYTENKIYKVSQSGEKTVFSSSEDINGPIGMAIDTEGNIYVANYLSNNIAKISSSGDTSIIVTGLNKPYFLYIDNNGRLYVSEQDTNTISEINLTTKKGLYR